MKKLLASFVFLMSVGLLLSQSCPQGGAIPSGSSSLNSGGFSNSFSDFNLSAFEFQRMANDLASGRYLASVKSYDEVEGSPFFEKGNTTGTLVMNDDRTISDIPIKIDLYANEVIATNDKGEEIVLDTRFYKEIWVQKENETITFKKVNPKRPDIFYEVLYEIGDVAFFKDSQASLKEGRNLGITNEKSKFHQYSRYYVTGEDDTLVKVNLKKRDVFDHFPEMQAVAMREYLKKSKIKLSKERDYKELFAAMDDD
jgi:hypothetical protein